MALSVPYYSSVDRALDDVSTAAKGAASVLFGLKELLRGGISGTNGPAGARPSSAYWTLVKSSDSVTAGVGDNLGGATFTAGKWVRAAAGNPHSWFLLRSSSSLLDGVHEICIDYVGSTDQQVDIILAKGSGAFSGGTTSARPTAAVETKYADQQFAKNGTSAGKLHFFTDAAGNFFFLLSYNASGRFSFALCVVRTVDSPHAGDLCRTVMNSSYLDSGRGAMQWGNNGDGSAQWRGFTFDGLTAIDNNTGGMWCPFFQGGGGSFDVTVAQASAIDSKVDMVPTWFLFDNTGGKKTHRGRIPDTFLIGTAKAVGSVEPQSGTPETLVVGDIAIPSDQAPTI